MTRESYKRIEDRVAEIARDECVYDDEDVQALRLAADVLCCARTVANASRSRASSMIALRGAIERADMAA